MVGSQPRVNEEFVGKPPYFQNCAGAHLQREESTFVWLRLSCCISKEQNTGDDAYWERSVASFWIAWILHISSRIFTINGQGGYDFPHFVDEETEATEANLPKVTEILSMEPRLGRPWLLYCTAFPLSIHSSLQSWLGTKNRPHRGILSVDNN